MREIRGTWGRWLLAAWSLPLLAGCAHQYERLTQRLDALEAQVEEMKRADRSSALHVEDLENRILLLRDEVETRQTVLYRDRRAAELPVVHVAPAPQPAAPAPVAEDYPVLSYQSLDAAGDLVPGGDAEPGAAPPHALTARAPQAHAPQIHAEDAAPVRPHAESGLSPADEQRGATEYRAALALEKKGRYDEAARAFAHLVEHFPRHPLANNALYWMGECYYARKQYLEALPVFQRVIREYPDGSKVPDAMLKTGLCYQNLGEPAQAEKVLLQVREIYPQSDAAKIAMERIERIRSGQGG